MKLLPGKKASCQLLLTEYKNSSNGLKLKGEKLHFSGVGDRDVYNITAPFEDEGELLIAGRVEARDSEEAEAVFFREEKGKWLPLEGAPTFKLQDPFVCRIKGELIFGGVETFPHPRLEAALGWRTIFYRGKNVQSLKPFARGPEGMKDIRLVELKDGKIGVFTRPQGEVGGRGTIGFLKLDSLENLRAPTLEKARLLSNQFLAEEWGGVNEVHLLANGLLGVLGHIACFDENKHRHYYPMVFPFDPEQEIAGAMKIISCRDDFPQGPAKRPDLVDVLFSGGLRRQDNGKAVLYVGVSDAEAHRITIPDPFLNYVNS